MASLKTSSRKADSKASPIVSLETFFATLEGAATSYGASQESGISARKTLTAALLSGTTRGMSEDAFASFKTDATAHYLAAYLNARQCQTSYDSVRKLWADGVKASAHGKTLAPDGANNLAEWDTKVLTGAMSARKLISNAFADAGLDIKTNGPAAKKEEAKREPRPASGAATPEGNSSDPKTAGETIRTAAPNDIAAALATLPEDIFAQVIGEAAGLRIAKGCAKIANSHFVTALLVARDARNQENATPATKCA